jgi:hypothetical protein
MIDFHGPEVDWLVAKVALLAVDGKQGVALGGGKPVSGHRMARAFHVKGFRLKIDLPPTDSIQV